MYFIFTLNFAVRLQKTPGDKTTENVTIVTFSVGGYIPANGGRTRDG